MYCVCIFYFQYLAHFYLENDLTLNNGNIFHLIWSHCNYFNECSLYLRYEK